jgi:uncharacterized Zn finger protein (UPF0148 family)
MFEKVLRELERMKQMQVSVPIETDDEGYYDKECPSDNCLFQFKVLADDWRDKFKDESVFCPLCGHNAPANNFWTTEQIEKSKEQTIQQVKSRLNKAFAESARDFNRRYPKGGFLTMKMEFKGSSTSSFILPIPAKKELEQKIECANCGANYSVLGSAFFCPCCGHNSVNETFDNSIKKIKSKIKNIDTIRKAVSEISEDEAELTVRSLIESGLSDGVVAFQRFCELTYKNNLKEDKKVKFNAFQNLEIGDQYWKDLIGESYIDWLSESEYGRLNILFQKRHLLAHTEGIVDEKYIEKSKDLAYKVGQRIVIKENDVLEIVELINKLVDKIRKKLALNKV